MSGRKREKVGSGITKSEHETFDLLTADGLEAYLADQTAGRFKIETQIAVMKRWADAELTRAGFGPGVYVRTDAGWAPSPDGFGTQYFAVPRVDGRPDDSREGYAGRIVLACLRLSHSLKQGDAERAAQNAAELFTLWTECRLKYRWERSALFGDEKRHKSAENFRRENAKRKAAAAAEHRRWQQEADAVRRECPWLRDDTAVADVVKTRLVLKQSIRTIRRIIAK